MTIRKRMVLPLALALGALGMMVMATAASATHPRPAGATPLRASMVPAYKPCPNDVVTSPNRTHGPPLSFLSCNPPVQSSASLTVGTPDANGAGANSVGSIRLSVKVGQPGLPEDSDVNIAASITDVRCKAGVAACGSANTADGPDYTGELEGTAQIRISDHWNAVAPGGGPDAATVIDIPFPVVTGCTATASAGIGSTCAITTTANAVVPGSVKDTKRAIVEIGQLQVFDGGTDGVAATDPNTLFSVQGIFIP
jgi:hypothetical protein